MSCLFGQLAASRQLVPPHQLMTRVSCGGPLRPALPHQELRCLARPSN